MTHRTLTHEEHGEVVGTWAELGYLNETIVCLDRHLDLKPLSASDAAVVRSAAGDRDRLRQICRRGRLRAGAGAFGLDDFWAAGPITGHVTHLLWVRPVWTSAVVNIDARRELVDAVRNLPMSATDAQSIRFEGPVLTFDFQGLDVGIVNAPDVNPATIPARVDLDLDWLWDPKAQRAHPVQAMRDVIDRTELADAVDTATWSISSGFAPPDLRDLTNEVERTLGVEFVPSTGTSPVDLETDPSGAAVLDALDKLARGDIHAAVADCRSLSGDPKVNSPLPYKIGVFYASQGLHREALPWLIQAGDDPVDTMAAHARVLAALSAYRSGVLAVAESLCRRLLDELPINRSVIDIALRVAADQRSRDLAERAAAARSRFDQLVCLHNPAGHFHQQQHGRG